MRGTARHLPADPSFQTTVTECGTRVRSLRPWVLTVGAGWRGTPGWQAEGRGPRLGTPLLQLEPGGVSSSLGRENKTQAPGLPKLHHHAFPRLPFGSPGAFFRSDSDSV